MKITTEEKISVPSHAAPRAMVWIAGILAAPFTGGLSLAAITIGEIGFAHERKNAIARTTEQTNSEMEAASQELQDQIRRGATSGRIDTYGFDEGNGEVRRSLSYRISDD